MPTILRTISDLTPLAAGVQAMAADVGGAFPPLRSLLVLAGYATLFSWLAV